MIERNKLNSKIGTRKHLSVFLVVMIIGVSYSLDYVLG